MGIKEWWASLNEPNRVMERIEQEGQRAVDNHRSESYISRHDDPVKLKKAREERRKERESHLWAQMLLERKTVNVYDFDDQLERVILAAKAVSNIESAKITESPASRVVYRHFLEEKAKLRLLSFSDVTIAPETAEAWMNAMIDKEEADEAAAPAIEAPTQTGG